MSRVDDLIAELCPDGVEYKTLGEICTIFNGYAFKSNKFNTKGIGIPIIRIRDINTGFSGTFYSGEYDNKWIVKNNDILIGMDGDFGITRWRHGRALLNQRVCRIQEFSNYVIPDFIYYLLKKELDQIHSTLASSTVKHLSSRALEQTQIPIPPLEVQREIVQILDKFTKLEAELEARHKQYKHYFRRLLSFAPGEAKELTLGDIGRVAMCKRIFKNETSKTGDVPFFKIGTFGGDPDAYISRDIFDNYRAKYSFPKPGDILISAAGTIGRTVTYKGEDAYFQDSNIVWLDHDELIVSNAYLKYWYQVVHWKTDGGTIKRLYNTNLLRTKILVPPLEEQHRIVEILDKFDTLVNNLTIGLPAEINARHKQYEHYHNKLLTFKQQTT